MYRDGVLVKASTLRPLYSIPSSSIPSVAAPEGGAFSEEVAHGPPRRRHHDIDSLARATGECEVVFDVGDCI